MFKAKIMYLFQKEAEWFLFEDGVETPISAAMAQELAEEHNVPQR